MVLMDRYSGHCGGEKENGEQFSTIYGEKTEIWRSGATDIMQEFLFLANTDT